ncbi:MAG: hypothetical protein D6705_01380 [Deltaproteobacteria bacterium]|nr:MAG: hypothetical protein D6705_01380 [Deltaproteobacteria bacterium]
MSGPRGRFRRFIGISLGGGRGKQTAVARLSWEPGAPSPNLAIHHAATRIGHRGTGDHGEHRPVADTGYLRDAELEAYLDAHVTDATLVAVDAPLVVPPCLRCDVPCPGVAACPVDEVRFATRIGHVRSGKPAVLPYVERACEVVRQREALPVRAGWGQGTAPLAARMHYLRRRFAGRLVAGVNLVEVAPRAAVVRWFGEETERRTRAGALADVRRARADVLESLRGRLRFDHVWPELVVRQRAVFYAVIASVVACDLARCGWSFEDTVAEPLAAEVARSPEVFVRGGWIWVPPPGGADP